MYRQHRQQGITKISPRPIYRPIASPVRESGKEFWAIALFLSVLFSGITVTLALVNGLKSWNKSQESVRIEELQHELKMIRSSVCK